MSLRVFPSRMIGIRSFFISLTCNPTTALYYKPGTQGTPTSYRESIDDSYLRICLTACCIKADSMDLIDEAQLRDCLRTKASYEPRSHELCRIDSLVSSVKMDSALREAENRIWTVHHHYTSVPQSAGIQNFAEKKPHTAIKHIF